MTTPGTVETYQDASGSWRWRLKAANGEIVATGESHLHRADAQRAFVTAMRLGNAALAEQPKPPPGPPNPPDTGERIVG